MSRAHATPDQDDPRDLLLRLTVRTLGCRDAAIAALATAQDVTVIASIGKLPALPAASLHAALGASEGIMLSTPQAAGWTFMAIPLPTEGGPPLLLVAGSPPNDPLEPSLLDALADIARAAATMGLAAHDTDTPPRLSSLSGRADTARLLGTLLGGKTQPRSLGFLRIEIDNLARLNALHGWDVTDGLIATVARRIQEILPGGSLLSHYGGGSFAVVTPRDLSATNTRSCVAAILRRMEAPFALDDGGVRLTVSIGWAMYPANAETREDLALAAVAALSQAVRGGGGHDRRADLDIVQAYRAARTLEQDLAQAVHQNGLHLTWQPTIATGTETIVAFEALSRWNRPGHGAVSPDLFVQCAEEAGLIEALDGWSLLSACQAAVNWSQPLRVCVNISPVWLSNGRLSALIERVLHDTGLAPERLQIELSEHRAFGSSVIAHQELSRVRALGARIALDDFGAGFSSLNRLGTLPVDQIKLDRSFVQRLGDDLRVDTILSATLRLAANLGVGCCAKGVETERQLAFLDAHGCDEVQGFLLGKPTGDSQIVTSAAI